MTSITLDQALALHGMTHARNENTTNTGKHDIYDANGTHLGAFTAHQAWTMLLTLRKGNIMVQEMRKGE
jgi:hypothetical protein